MTKRIVHSEDIEFEAIEPTDLESVSVVSQALDNQWVPKDMLHKMIKKGLSLKDVKTKREEYVRTEYIRALINASQVVINRAYVYNNPVVFQDYLRLGEDRDAFIELMNSGVIVPYLYNEQSPYERPTYSTDPRGFPAWERVSVDARIQCVRLSWDDDSNQEFIRAQLTRRFHNFAMTANTVDFNVIARDLGLPPEYGAALKKRLIEVANECLNLSSQNKLATREHLYKKFVTEEGTPPALGKYDRNKPFAGEIKQLLDLRYNINLPDALGGYGLTPIGSLPRTALQEWQQLKGHEINTEELLELLRQSAFSLVQEGLFLKSVGMLNLKEVQEIRLTDEWAEYIISLRDLMDNPLHFLDQDRGAQVVYQNYVELAKVMTNVVKAKKVKVRTAKWTPVVEFVLNVAGGVLSVVWSGKGIFYTVTGGISSTVTKKGAPVVTRLIVRGYTEIGAQADLRTSFDFMRGTMDHAREQWKELQNQLSRLQGFTKLDTTIQMEKNALINYSGESNE
ncbi:MAG: hypothetical protein JSW00_13035 [Thermoplasmata archaeon]|nr:MAG: hypothetical protein JSW00_13035 [Thermoplasmata archaeon]